MRSRNFLAHLDDWQKYETIPSKEIAKDKSRLDEYGLNKAKLRLTLLGKDAPPEILFGNDAAIEGKMYVRLADAKDVFLAAQSVRNDIAKKPEDFRDKKLTDLTTASVTRVLLKTAAGEMELEKKTDHWEITKPLRARGDDQKIGDLISQVTTAHIQQFVAEDRGDLHPYGLVEPRGAITLFSEDDKQGQTLQVGGIPEKEKEQVYVRFAARHAVYLAEKDRRDSWHEAFRSARSPSASPRHKSSRPHHDRRRREKAKRCSRGRMKIGRSRAETTSRPMRARSIVCSI